MLFVAMGAGRSLLLRFGATWSLPRCRRTLMRRSNEGRRGAERSEEGRTAQADLRLRGGRNALCTHTRHASTAGNQRCAACCLFGARRSSEWRAKATPAAGEREEEGRRRRGGHNGGAHRAGCTAHTARHDTQENSGTAALSPPAQAPKNRSPQVQMHSPSAGVRRHHRRIE